MSSALAMILAAGMTAPGAEVPAPKSKEVCERVIPQDSRWIEDDGYMWEFRKGGELQTTNKKGEKDFPSRYVLRPKENPPQIDISTIDGTGLGIYRLGGDRLEICWSCPGVERPTSFTSRKEGQELLILHRVKPGK